MITALTIKNELPNSLRGKLRALFSPYEIKVRRISEKRFGFEMLHVTYVRKSGKIRFGKIKRSVHADFHETLCAREIKLPRKLGFVRFENPMYIRLLCINSAEDYIRKLNADPSKLRISLIDQSGRYSFAAESLIKFTSSLRIATNAADFYKAENERFMREYGAEALIYGSPRDIVPCDILVSPQVITTPISCGGRTVVFTSARPKAPVSGIVHDNFTVKLPPFLESIKPSELSDVYFMSAVCAACGNDFV